MNKRREELYMKHSVEPSGVVKRKLTIGVDVDDTLVILMPEVFRIVNEEFGLNLTVKDNTEWGLTNYSEEVRNRIFELFQDPYLYSRLPMMDGAQEFITDLYNRGHRIVIVSATLFASMSARAMYVKNNFPEVKDDNIVLTASKDLLELDILFDDKPANILDSNARVPVLVTQPWNHEIYGQVRADSIPEYTKIVELVEQGFNKQDIYQIQNPRLNEYDDYIITLSGNSGSGKTTIANAICDLNNTFEKVITSTTRAKRENEVDGVDYYFYDHQTFQEMLRGVDLLDDVGDLSATQLETSAFAEHTVYLGESYGIEKKSIDSILKKGKTPIVVLDERGVKSLKAVYGPKVVSIFINRDSNIITSILERKTSNEEKEKRIKQLFLDNDLLHSEDKKTFSFAVRKLYDYNILNDKIDRASNEIIKLIRG